MNNNTRLIKIIQSIIKPKTINKFVNKNNYNDTGRKLSVMQLFNYFVLSSICKFKSFRKTEILGQKYFSKPVDFTTLSKKAKEVPYEIFRDIFEDLIKNYNHKQRRFIQKNLKIKAIDSSLITFVKKETKTFADYKKIFKGLKFIWLMMF